MPLSTELLDSLHQQTEQFLQKALTSWQMLPPNTLARVPATYPAGAWSAAQCLEHLNIYGRHYLPAIETAIQAARKSGRMPATKEFHAGWLGAYFTKLMRPTPAGKLQSKMKAPKNALPAAQPDARAILAEFIDQQEKMLQLLDLAAAVDLKRVRVPTSLSPWIRLRLGDTFSFVIAHIERHLLQVERALEALRTTALVAV